MSTCSMSNSTNESFLKLEHKSCLSAGWDNRLPKYSCFKTSCAGFQFCGHKSFTCDVWDVLAWHTAATSVRWQLSHFFLDCEHTFQLGVLSHTTNNACKNGENFKLLKWAGYGLPQDWTNNCSQKWLAR